jgi:hypothetical protein
MKVNEAKKNIFLWKDTATPARCFILASEKQRSPQSEAGLASKKETPNIENAHGTPPPLCIP